MVSSADIDYEESMCTLRYAARVKHIQNHARINVEHGGLIEGFEQEIAELQEKIHLLSVQEQKQPVTKKKKERSSSQARADEIRKCEEELQKTEYIVFFWHLVHSYCSLLGKRRMNLCKRYP